MRNNRQDGEVNRLLQSIQREEKSMSMFLPLPQHLIAVCLPGATILCGVCAESEERAREIAETEIRSQMKGTSDESIRRQNVSQRTEYN
jgi:hypothetical protein